jgi:hypothetical protein
VATQSASKFALGISRSTLGTQCCKALVDEGLRSADSTDTTIFYFFFHQVSEQRSVTRALSAILRKLFSTKKALIRNAVYEFLNYGNSLSEMFVQMWSILQTDAADSQAGEIICVLDAIHQTAKEFLISRGNLDEDVVRPGV